MEAYFPGTGEPGGLSSMGSHWVGHDWSDLAAITLQYCIGFTIHQHESSKLISIQELIYMYIGEGNGNPLQYSCLENPVDREIWWAAVCGVTQGRTQMKWLSSSSSSTTHKQILTQYVCSERQFVFLTNSPGESYRLSPQAGPLVVLDLGSFKKSAWQISYIRMWEAGRTDYAFTLGCSGSWEPPTVEVS